MGNSGTAWEVFEGNSEHRVSNRLPDTKIREMRERAAKGATQSELADLYHYSISAISLLLRGLRRKNAGGPIINKRGGVST